VLLLDEPLAGLAAAERERVGNLVKTLSADIPVLLVEHDIDRVFRLADRVTVMADGEVLVDGTVEDARHGREGAGRLSRLRRHGGRGQAAARPPRTATRRCSASRTSTPSTARATS
jgi:energy-coupling factor transporter ATP-binding protein EcfA2